MSKMKKAITGILLLAMVFTVMNPVKAKAADSSPVSISMKDNKALTYQAGKAQDWVMIVKNNTDQELTGVTVYPDMGQTSDAWPFKTDYQSYSVTVDKILASGQAEIKFSFTQREDVQTSRFTIPFNITAGDQTVTRYFYVNTTAKPEEKKEESGGQDSGGQSSQPMPYSDGGGDSFPADAGGFSNGGASYSGGGESGGSGSVPRVIVTGFTTEPAEVKAGSDFTLTIHLRNTAKSTKVNNMLFDLNAPTEGTDEQTSAPAFLPASGASSIYLDGITADGTADISIQLNAKADLLQKPYSIDLSMKYEDANAAQIEGTSSISIPVKQDARFEFSDFEINPESIAVGEEGNVMCSLYNLGRIKLYNVKATFEGKGIKKEEVFIGNVESGATASIDAMLKGQKATNGPDKITMTLSYEDEAGKISSTNKDFELEVMEESNDMVPTAGMEEEVKGGVPVVPIIVGIVIIIAAAAVVFVIRKKKKKQMSNEEEELLDELDGPSEDEQ